MDILLRNGTMVTPFGERKADIRIRGEKIQAIAGTLAPEAGEKVFELDGKYVLPGLIDSHTHYHLVSRGTVTCDSFEQGSRLASYGGVTTVIDFADHNRGQNLECSAEARLEEMRGGMAVDYSLHQGVYGHGYGSDIPSQLGKIAQKGIRTLKIFTTYRNAGYLIENEDDIKDLFENAERMGLLVTAHCEYNPLIEQLSDNWKGDFSPSSHAKLRPAEAEGKAIEHFGAIALKKHCPLYVVHVSSECGLNAIRKLRKAGLTVYAETTPHYLFLDRSYLDGKDGPLYVMTPPLREKSDNIALQNALKNGEIQVVATDHCAFTRTQKLASSDCRSIFPGIPGTEEMFMILAKWCLSNGMTLSDVVRLTSSNPARIFGLYPEKGSLDIGTDADIAVFDMSRKFVLSDETIHSASKYTPYRGFETAGKFILTIRRGEILLEDGKYLGKPGSGKFLEQKESLRVPDFGGEGGKLALLAFDAIDKAYCRYSHFPVGAALVTEKGFTYCGSNVENISFGGSICAERSAALSAVLAEGNPVFKALAVVSDSDDPAFPCAICRQFLSEFAAPDMMVYVYSRKSGKYKSVSFEDLMPYSFSAREVTL